MVYKPILAFLSFCSLEVLSDFFSEDDVSRPQEKNERKSTPGEEQKGIQKSGKKSALIPYLDNIEITSIKIFAKSPEKSNKSSIFLVNRLFSVFGSSLIYDRIVKVVCLGVKYPRERGSLLEINTHREVYLD